MTKILDPKILRSVAGAFATGVTVITTYNDEGEIHGMTANSFVSISLDPPLVAFSVRNNGTLMQFLKKGKPVSISILSEQQIDVSNQFANMNETPIKIEYQQHADSVPTIKDCIAWYTTTIEEMILAGDHHIVLCKVEDLHRATNGNPLLYYSGYQSIATK